MSHQSLNAEIHWGKQSNIQKLPEDVVEDGRLGIAVEDLCDEAEDEVVGASPPLRVVLSDKRDPWKSPFDMPVTEEDATLEFKPGRKQKMSPINLKLKP